MPETNTPQTTEKTPDMRTQNIRLAVSIYLRTIFAAVLCFIVYTSITIIVSAAATKKIGVEIYEVGKDGKGTLVSVQYYNTTSTSTKTSGVSNTGTSATAPGSAGAAAAGSGSAKGTATSVGTTTAGTAATGTVSAKASTYQVEKRSKLSPTAEWVSGILSQLFLLMLLIVMPYSILWERGDKDCNSVHFGHMQEDKLRGLKVGLMASIPSILAYLILVLSKLGLISSSYVFIYRFLNLAFIPVYNGLVGTAGISWGGMAVLLLTVAVVPLTGYIAYWLGYRQISLSEKIIYVNPNKKKKRRY